MKTIISFIKNLLRRKKEKTAPRISVNPQYIVPRTEHTISKTHISQNALKVIQKLHHSGFEAYLVGGGVRDLLLNKQPKDFDVATNATPNEIKKLFKNARIIGRRFKLVHVWFYRETIEVATFRSSEPSDENQKTNEQGMLIRDNVYGNIYQDAERRDFSINALYYSPEEGHVIDIVGGMKDIKEKTLRIIGEASRRYQEDPVRMLRVVRFAAKLNLTISPETASEIHTLNGLIRDVSNARLFDEIVKLYQCGASVQVQDLLMKYGIFPHLFPHISALPTPLLNQAQTLIKLALESTDSRIKQEKPVTPAFLFAIFFWFPLQEKIQALEAQGYSPLQALEQAMSVIIHEQNRVIAIPKRFTQIMREIWLLQYRLPKRLGGRAQHLLTHPRFRAAYDMLALRALAGDAPSELAEWWTRFQEADESTKETMVLTLIPKKRKKRPAKKKKPIDKTEP